ncbi:twin-arginine translocation signal domain-containing protein [Streptomyces sp. P17]|uniref:twin-arginine translocation signal domain-containing protein n=1 Tax=Streptomyces sp. P17 TaxID=3074716 RepID=UPI0028F45A86|nr:twin-arginine translocation signal domain-containing protein [Streptomyces sp. P17]MDT9698287.1 twin-arginine translocation signal domain-containing protein [Streptomyces sp. P17]
MNHEITRRTVIRTAAVIGAGAGIGSVLPAAHASAVEGRTPKRPATSANGWTVQANADRDSQVWTRPVAGTGLSVPVWIGDVEAILLHVVRRFHYEVEEISRVDLAGWRPVKGLRRGLPESNLASGTAVQIRPGASAAGGFFPLQELVLRDILADCEGVVRWGGDDSQVDESLFYIDAGPQDERVRRVADKLRGWDATPGEGAGAGVDVLSPSRRRRADRLARIQHPA